MQRLNNYVVSSLQYTCDFTWHHNVDFMNTWHVYFPAFDRTPFTRQSSTSQQTTDQWPTDGDESYYLQFRIVFPISSEKHNIKKFSITLSYDTVIIYTRSLPTGFLLLWVLCSFIYSEPYVVCQDCEKLLFPQQNGIFDGMSLISIYILSPRLLSGLRA